MRVQSVYKAYGEKQVLSDFSAVFQQGRITALMGPSGCGKTTLLRILLGLEAPDSGEVSLPSDSVAAVFQEDRLSEPLTAVANVRLVRPDTPREEIRDLLCRLGLAGEDCEKPVSTLSGGMRRRVAIARAIAKDPDILILDEPFSALDAETKQEVISYLKEALVGKTVLLVTHDEREAAAFADQIITFSEHK